MFNSELKKEWLDKLDLAKEEYQNEMNTTQDEIQSLFNERVKAVKIIKNSNRFINTIANTPKSIRVKLNETHSYIAEFVVIISLKDKSEIIDKISGGIAGAGALAGAGVATLGPTAAMAIATTFGTASTGTAISTLSGAVATNAALAWLGGGALAIGGGGMAAGNAFLALAGPVGWAIGGLSLVGSVLFASSKNKKIAGKAESAVYELKSETKNIISTRAEITATKKLTADHIHALTAELIRIKILVCMFCLSRRFMKFILIIFKKSHLSLNYSSSKSYRDFPRCLKTNLGTLVNNTHSLASLVEKKIGQNNEE